MSLIYLISASILIIIFVILDNYIHHKPDKTVSIIFHTFGIIITLIPAVLLFLSEFKISILIYPASILSVFGFWLILISHIDLGENFYRAKKIITSGIYARVRHPMSLGLIILFMAYFLFSYSLYILIYSLIGIVMIIWLMFAEERYLLKRFKNYQKYKKQVPMLIPKL